VCTEAPPDDVNICNLFEIVKVDVKPSVEDVSDVAGDPESGQPRVSIKDMVEEKSFGLGDMLHETVADAKVVVLCVIWLGIGGSTGAEWWRL
jgi:hypothetical protein